MKVIIKYLANIGVLLGVVLLLCVILFANSKSIAIGEMAYQKLWLGYVSIVFAGVYLFSFCLNKLQYFSFYSLVTWVLIVLGGIEAIWGLRQIYGMSISKHSLYLLTGSFCNPGPYSGYLAMVFPLCLNEWLNLKKKKKHAWVEKIKYYIALGVMFLILCVLPAGMSRSAWLAAVISGIWVYGARVSWRNWLHLLWQKYRKKTILAFIAGVFILVMIAYTLFQFKTGSANGRLFMWKISCLAISQKPFMGYGSNHFALAYGMAQEEYFSKKDYSRMEELVAGCPEYAFNEYLQLTVEYGFLFLTAVLLIIAFCLWKGWTDKRFGVCGSVISVLVFAFSTYPMQIPGFAMTFYFLLAACVIGSSRIYTLLFVAIIALLGSYYWRYNQYDACKEWYSCKMLYNIGAYQSAKNSYEKLYPKLNNRGAFLFEYGHCLHKLKEYDASTEIMKEAITLSCDPMILNIIGKNYQATEDYDKAEKYFLRSTHRLPGRIYPYYLLAKLYAEPKYWHPEKLKQAVKVVLTKEPKVQSTVIKEMREEAKLLLKDNGR